MSNHYHVGVRVNSAKAADWKDADVIVRWGLPVPDGDVPQIDIDWWRLRLADLSWHMLSINENLTRRPGAIETLKIVSRPTICTLS